MRPANPRRASEKHADLFQMCKLNVPIDDHYKKKFTCNLLYDVCDNFVGETVEYKVGGAYYCNENDYLEYSISLYFGFMKRFD